MIAPDRGHLAATHKAAVRQDEKMRLWVRDLSASSAEAGSVGAMVRGLREHGDYWERVQKGRLQKVKRLLARLMKPFFSPQVRYNLIVAEHLGCIEVAMDEMRREIESLREAVKADSPPR
jgi:hypothetical protein